MLLSEEALQLQQRARGCIGGTSLDRSWDVNITPKDNSSAYYLTYKVKLAPSLPGTIQVYVSSNCKSRSVTDPEITVEKFLFSVSYAIETLPFANVVGRGVTFRVYVSFWMSI